MADISQAEKESVLHRQTLVGSGDLTPEEKDKIAKINLEKAVEGIKSDVIPPAINELIKKQTNAGTPGYPDLTEEEREILRKFYADRA